MITVQRLYHQAPTLSYSVQNMNTMILNNNINFYHPAVSNYKSPGTPHQPTYHHITNRHKKVPLTLLHIYTTYYFPFNYSVSVRTNKSSKE